MYTCKQCRIKKFLYLDVEDIISESPTQTPCLFSGISDLRPSSRIGIISGSTLSPSFLTRSPRVRAATLKDNFSLLPYLFNYYLPLNNFPPKKHWSRQDSNLHLQVRDLVPYPLDDMTCFCIQLKSSVTFETSIVKSLNNSNYNKNCQFSTYFTISTCSKWNL